MVLVRPMALVPPVIPIGTGQLATSVCSTINFHVVFIKFLLDCDAGSCSNHGGCSLNGSCNCNPNYYGTTCNTCMNSFVCLKSYSLQIVWTQTAEVVHAILQEHVPAMQTITNQIAQLVCSLQNSVLDILFTFL